MLASVEHHAKFLCSCARLSSLELFRRMSWKRKKKYSYWRHRWTPRRAGIEHTLSFPASQGNYACYSCSQGTAELHDLHFHQQVSTDHTNLDNCKAAIFSHTDQPQFFWNNFSNRLESSTIFLYKKQEGSFLPVFTMHLFLTIVKKILLSNSPLYLNTSVFLWGEMVHCTFLFCNF